MLVPDVAASRPCVVLPCCAMCPPVCRRRFRSVLSVPVACLASTHAHRACPTSPRITATTAPAASSSQTLAVTAAAAVAAAARGRCEGHGRPPCLPLLPLLLLFLLLRLLMVAVGCGCLRVTAALAVSSTAQASCCPTARSVAAWVLHCTARQYRCRPLPALSQLGRQAVCTRLVAAAAGTALKPLHQLQQAWA